MLYEINHVDQKEADWQRRWFFDREMDLLLWLRDGEIRGFQLCYDKTGDPRALTWFAERGFAHNRVEERDEKRGVFRGSPLLLRNGVWDPRRLAAQFQSKSAGLEAGIATFVYEKILQVRL